MTQIRGLARRVDAGQNQEAVTSQPSGPKVTIGFPGDPSLMSLRTYLNTKVTSRNDLVKCLGHIISSLPILQIRQKNHQHLTIDNIYVGARGKNLEHICFSVDNDRKRAAEEDMAALGDIAKSWCEAHPDTTEETTEAHPDTTEETTEAHPDTTEETTV